MLKKGISYDTLTDFAAFAKEMSLKVNRGVKLNIECLWNTWHYCSAMCVERMLTDWCKCGPLDTL